MEFLFMDIKQYNSCSIPIIFIHYGDSDYLKYTLRSTKIFNSNSRVILLGDESNQYCTYLGIEHFYFKDYGKSPEMRLFEKVYRFIAGSEHGKTEWTHFVFKRWFHIFEFIQSHGIEQFWTFDSDNLVLVNLEKFSVNLSKYDCTEQCNGICMNGFVNSQKIVKGYIDTINSLFMDVEYLKKQVKDFITNSDYAFTEMRAYDEYRQRSNLNAIRLQTLLDEETFDECLCQSQGMEFINGKKKLFFKNGFIYQKNILNQKLLKVNTINMSWTDISLIEELFTYAVNNHLNKFPKNHFLIRCKIRLQYCVFLLPYKLIKRFFKNLQTYHS